MEENKRVRGKGDDGRCTKQRSKKKYAGKRKSRKNKSKTNNIDVLEDSVTNVDVGDSVQLSSCSVDFNIRDEEMEEIVEDVPAEAVPEAVSNIKVVDIEEVNLPDDKVTGYRFVDMPILDCVFNSLACPECFTMNSLQLKDIVDKKKGLARFIQISCSSCPYKKEFYTSKEVDRKVCIDEKNSGGGKHMEVNLRAVYGMRAIGVGHKQLEKLCSHRNMPEPMDMSSYNKVSCVLKDTVQQGIVCIKGYGSS